MSTKKEKGREGEKATVNYLKKRGYSIIATNYLVKGSEIDIIAIKEDCIHFIEVKTRSDNLFGTPAEAVDPYKQKSIIHGAKIFLMKNPNYFDLRCSFDVSEVYLFNRLLFNKKINYFEDAFQERSSF